MESRRHVPEVPGLTLARSRQRLLRSIRFVKNKDFPGISLIWRFLSNPMQMQKYFLDLKSTMPSLSPVDKNWPPRPYLFLDSAHKELKRIFHLWRVKNTFFSGDFFPHVLCV